MEAGDRVRPHGTAVPRVRARGGQPGVPPGPLREPRRLPRLRPRRCGGARARERAGPDGANHEGGEAHRPRGPRADVHVRREGGRGVREGERGGTSADQRGGEAAGGDPSVPRGERASLRDQGEGPAHRGRGATAPAHRVPEGEGRGTEGARAYGPLSPAPRNPRVSSQDSKRGIVSLNVILHPNVHMDVNYPRSDEKEQGRPNGGRPEHPRAPPAYRGPASHPAESPRPRGPPALRGSTRGES